jgi:hypothetical protein
MVTTFCSGRAAVELVVVAYSCLFLNLHVCLQEELIFCKVFQLKDEGKVTSSFL